MITITNAWTQRGWDSYDHMINDSRLVELIGRQYKTLASARRAARTRAYRGGYYSIEYTMGGRTYLYDDSARLAIPGRHVAMVREVA